MSSVLDIFNYLNHPNHVQSESLYYLHLYALLVLHQKQWTAPARVDSITTPPFTIIRFSRLSGVTFSYDLGFAVQNIDN